MIISIITLLISLLLTGIITFRRSSKKIVPVSVNYHFTRRCNYACGFCFHTATTSHLASLNDAKKALSLLKTAGMKKINFSGGEPFLYPRRLGQMCAFCKEDLGLESVSIVSNGSHINEKWFQQYGKHVDILAVSCDSFDEKTNVAIGRGNGTQIQKLKEIAGFCEKYGVKFKINSVINRFNHEEDMNPHIAKLSPFRWKCFQVLIVQGENSSAETLRDASKFVITDEEYQKFCERHQKQKSFVPEPNNLMRTSYLIMDEYLRLLNRGPDGGPTEPILEIGVQEALKKAGWDEESFIERGGIYDWTRPAESCSSGASNGALDW
ncbi:hypothetical protein RUND412_004309 [Rhizina undulata]